MRPNNSSIFFIRFFLALMFVYSPLSSRASDGVELNENDTLEAQAIDFLGRNSNLAIFSYQRDSLIQSSIEMVEGEVKELVPSLSPKEDNSYVLVSLGFMNLIYVYGSDGQEKIVPLEGVLF